MHLVLVYLLLLQLLWEIPLANNNNAEGKLMNASRNIPNVEENLEEIKNYMIEKVKRQSLDQVQK